MEVTFLPQNFDYLYLCTPALNIQLRLNGILNCCQYTTSDTNQKAQDITVRLARGINSICGCGFNTTFITNAFLRCFDEDSPQHVTYRAVLSETELTTAVELVSYIEQWAEVTQTLVVQSIQLGINTTCPVVITDFNSPECPEIVDNQVTSPTTSYTSTTVGSSSGGNGFVVGGAIAGVLLVVVIATAVVVILVLVMMRKKTGSTNIQTSGSKYVFMLCICIAIRLSVALHLVHKKSLLKAINEYNISRAKFNLVTKSKSCQYPLSTRLSDYYTV